MEINIKLRPWEVPIFVIGETPARPRQEGFNPDGGMKWPITEVDADTLGKLCDQFREEVFRKAAKPDPKDRPPPDISAIPEAGDLGYSMVCLCAEIRHMKTPADREKAIALATGIHDRIAELAK